MTNHRARSTAHRTTTDAASYRTDLYAVLATAPDGERSAAGAIEEAIDVGTDYLGLSVGALTRIDDGVQEIVHAGGPADVVEPGDTCPLDEAYCRRTVESDGPLSVQDAAASNRISRAAYDAFGFDSYIGAKVIVNGEVYGTLCFADREERDRPFSEAEGAFVELAAELVAGVLERRAYEAELRRRNDRLEAEKRRLKGITENSFDVIFRVGLDATFTYVSSAAHRMLDHDPDDLVGEPFVDYMDDDSAAVATAAFQRLLDGEPMAQFEIEFLDGGGETVALEVNATPVHDPGIVGAQGVARDVTTRKAQRRELRLKDRAMDDAQIGITIADATDPDVPLVYVNDAFESITGYSRSEALGRNCRFLQGGETDRSTARRVADRIRANESVSVEILNYRRDGVPFWNRLTVNPVRDDEGTVTDFVGLQRDVTERKRTERLVALLNRVLRHNLSNDVNVVLGYGDLLRDGDPPGGAASEYAARIVETATDLADLSARVRELRRYADLDRRPERLAADALFDRLGAAAREAYPDATVDVALRTDRELCAGAEVEEAFAELLDNAIAHNPSSSPTASITVEDDGEWLEVTVRDDGPGIDGMEAAAIAAGEETPLEHSSGMGLWIVNWIVTRYGGSFRISPRDDPTGTTATVRLPAIDADTTVGEAARRPTALFW